MKRILPWQIVLVTSWLLVAGTLALAGDTSALKPPKGSKVALIVFEDMECPDCARAAPLLHEAAKKYSIPLVQYDFPLPMHPWSFEAAVNARYFDSVSKSLGDEYRLFIFSNQPSINKANLRGVTERFATDHKTTLPFVVDPMGELAGKVKADYQLGQRVGLDHTPTIYIVSDTTKGKPVIEVSDRTQLYTLIDQAIKDAGPSTPQRKAAGKSGSKTAPKTTAKNSGQ